MTRMHRNEDENRNNLNEILNLMQATCAGGHQSVLTKTAFWISSKLLTFSQDVWCRLEIWLQNSNIPEMAEHAMVYLMEHPPVALSVGVFLLACAFPIVVFLVFAVVSTIFTFIGFLIVEGTLLAVAGFILVSVLMGMLVTAVSIAALCGGVYLSIAKLSRYFSAFLGAPYIIPSRPPTPQPDSYMPTRVSRLRRGSAFFTAAPHQHDIFSLSHRGAHRH
ncbi:hypothetical protein J437_LFUL007885 [Ladona fulva]|uniref:Transmembrane protein 159 n=1 Tax=Ladona fulva TaxID=123851 RepID=A0A8K0K2T1_LADFU|nr:hypothetical protein J437_LFUL007885 [Ladona fulva]